MVSDETNGAVSGLDAEELSQLETLFSCYPEIRKVIFLVPEQKEQRGKTLISTLQLME